MPLAGRRPGARRVAAALLGLGGDALARGARVVTGRGAGAAPDGSTSPAPSSEGEAPPEKPPVAGEAARAAAEEAAARLDAARERLRATIARPADDDVSSDSA